MPDKREDMEASGFAEPDGPHPIANLKPLPAGEDVTKAYAEAGSARSGPRLTGTLPATQGSVSGDAPLLEVMNDGPAVITLADCTVTGRLIVSVFGEGTVDLDGRQALLSQLPEASPDARDAEVARLKVYITHLNAKINEKDGQIAMLTRGDTS